jgi:hypothetical protein
MRGLHAINPVQYLPIFSGAVDAGNQQPTELVGQWNVCEIPEAVPRQKEALKK